MAMIPGNKKLSLDKLRMQLLKLRFFRYRYRFYGESYDEQGSLLSLYLVYRKITQLPRVLSKFTSLQELNLSQNQLSSLPAELGWLTDLHILNLSNNQFSNLPPVLVHLTNLKYLNLSSNQFSSLPAALGLLTMAEQKKRAPKKSTPEYREFQLTNLQSLDLGGNKLSSLPADFYLFTNLHILNLSRNQFSNLPAALGLLANLQKLDLGQNQLGGSFTSLSLLTNLQELNLNGNQLSSLPSELFQLSDLQGLNLSGNQFSSLPAELGHLADLRTLNLSGNQLSALPAELFQLSELRNLDLSGNQLSDLSPGLGQLTNLNTLHLSRNQFSNLPPALGQLTKLNSLSLDNNPQLEVPPPEVVQQGTPAVLVYLRALLQAVERSEAKREGWMGRPMPLSALPQAVERFEAKLLLVGEGGMGKSSLLRSLRRQSFNPELPLTHGIDVGTLQLPHPTPGKQALTISTWDFGGQEIYQATHQLFLTRRSVYLLVWNARQGPDVCRLSFWLDTISTLAPDARILLVATHVDKGEPEPHIDVRRYQQDYPRLVGQCIVSNKDGRGLDELKREVASITAKTPLVGQIWPRDWVEAERELFARQEHHIDLAAFLQICARHQIGDDNARNVFGPVLHDLGKLLFFRDDPLLNQLVVLKPNWISKAISLVLDDLQVRRASGLLAHRELARIWTSDEQGHPYPPALYPIFLRFMERFDLCYQLEPARPGQPVTHSLVPLLLSEVRPASLPAPPHVASAGPARVEMRYTMSFVPAGLMSWLLVRTHRYSQQLHWREGAYLAYHSQQAGIKLDTHRREISLIAWGAFPYNFFSILRETLDTVLERFQGLRARREIPCICPRQQENPHWHDVDLLESQLQNGSAEITCPSGARLSLLTLMYGVHAEATTQVAVKLQQTRQLAAPTTSMSTEEQRQRSDMSQQILEHIYRTLIRLTNFEMQKEQIPCPSLFLLERESGNILHARDWMSQVYRLHLLCQYPAGPHLIKGEQGYLLREGKEWWKTISPLLRRLLGVLKLGVPLGKAVGEVFDQMDTERLTNQIGLLDEILTDLPPIDTFGSVNETGGKAHLAVEQHLEGAALRVLAHFLDSADPAHRWHGLDKVPMPDGGILWLCEKHKREFVSPPSAWI